MHGSVIPAVNWRARAESGIALNLQYLLRLSAGFHTWIFGMVGLFFPLYKFCLNALLFKNIPEEEAAQSNHSVICCPLSWSTWAVGGLRALLSGLSEPARQTLWDANPQLLTQLNNWRVHL